MWDDSVGKENEARWGDTKWKGVILRIVWAGLWRSDFEQQRLEGNESVSHQNIWSNIQAEVAASWKAPRYEQFPKETRVTGMQCRRRGRGKMKAEKQQEAQFI